MRIDNYVNMLSDRSMRPYLNNFIIWVRLRYSAEYFRISITGLWTLSLRHTAVRTFICYLPIMISGLIMGYIIILFLQYDGGILNEILGWFGREPVDWLADSSRGRIIILLVNSIQYYGNAMVLYLAGLQGIPALYYEAAEVDGAAAILQRFRYVTSALLGFRRLHLGSC